MKPPVDFIMHGPTANDPTISLYPQNGAATKEALERFPEARESLGCFSFYDELAGLKAVVELFRDGWRIG